MQNVFDTKVFKVLSKGKGDISYGWKGAGVAVPVFSLKSNNSFGVGEFLDLKLLADWCNNVGLKMIQILPINDTRTDGSWDNSYPYKAISTKALHPIYLNLDKMGQLVDENDREYFKQQKEILNAKDYVDYPEVMKVKEDYFRKIFLQTWNDIKEREDYKTFINENKDWLVPYASFCSQRDYESTRLQVNETTRLQVEMPITQSIAVDAACSGNPGKMEFQGVFVETKTNLFKSPVYEHGTNNIGEFLAIVYCLAWQHKHKLSYPIYSDSVNAQKWVREGVCKTKIEENEKNKPLFEVIRWAEKWLKTNSFRVPIYKWKTEVWGEIPADFGRK